MTSKLDGLFRGFVPAEKTDSWLGIRRDDQQDDPRGKKQKPDEEISAPEEDHATLSVAALYAFLSSLVVQTGDASATPSPMAGPSRAATLRPSAQAANAYQSAARAGGGVRINLEETRASPPHGATSAIDLKPEDRRTIAELLAQIDILAARNVSFIPLIPAPTFLGSLAEGVRQAIKASQPPS